MHSLFLNLVVSQDYLSTRVRNAEVPSTLPLIRVLALADISSCDLKLHWFTPFTLADMLSNKSTRASTDCDFRNLHRGAFAVTFSERFLNKSKHARGPTHKIDWPSPSYLNTRTVFWIAPMSIQMQQMANANIVFV